VSGDLNVSNLGRSESLSARLQNIRLSNNDRLAETPLLFQRQIETPKNDMPVNNISPEPHMKQAPERHITVETSLQKNSSPIVSPTARRRQNNGGEFPKSNGSTHRGRRKPSPEAHSGHVMLPLNDSKEKQNEGGSQKPAGPVAHQRPRDLGISGLNGGWQAAKKHKRNVKSVIDTRTLKGVESVPLDESLRKGG